MEFEQETNSSPWKKIHSSFKVCSVFHEGKKSLTNNKYKNKLFNQIRLVSINNITYLEVKTQKPEITFICDISNYIKLRQYTWTAYKTKNDNTYYIATKIKKDNKRSILSFHRLIKPEYKIINHIKRIGYDNRECNLRETTPRDNSLNRKLRKDNKSGYNEISYHKQNKRWRFQWYENKKLKTKWFKVKQEAIDFKVIHDKITGNMNGYQV
jgi:hypothetical protein